LFFHPGVKELSGDILAVNEREKTSFLTGNEIEFSCTSELTKLVFILWGYA
jgi:hypothetical protein